MNLEWGKFKILKVPSINFIRSRGEHSIFGVTLNPLDRTRSAGGSSSGCSAVVAGGLCRL